MIPFFKSIRWRIQIWYGLLFLGIIVAFSIIAHQIAWLQILHEVDEENRRKNLILISNLRRAVFAEPHVDSILRIMSANEDNAIADILMERLRKGRITLSEDTLAQFRGNDPGYGYFKIFDPRGNMIASSVNAPELAEIAPLPPEGADITLRTIENWREQSLAESSGLRMVIGKDISPERAQMRNLTLRIIAGASATWFVALMGGWLIAGYVIRPIRTISDAAVRASQGNLKKAIPLTKAGNELHDLAIVLNQTFRRLDESFERQRRFTADASHELRTPVTVILSETQRMKKRKRSEAEYKDAIEVCHTAAQRMRKLVENLLLLARQEGDYHALHLENFQLEHIISESVESHRILAAEKSIEIHSDLEPIAIQTDILEISTLLNNIIGNAISHHQGNGNVWVVSKLHNNASTLEVSVRDDGPGISGEDLPYIFDRFYQADKSRSSRDSHNGLGLSVCQSIAEQLGGRIDVTSVLGKGSTFTFTLPQQS